MHRLLPLAVLLALTALGPGCSCAEPSPLDAGSGGDVPGLDAPGRDAPALDVPVDGPVLDVPADDVPGSDAPGSDAPVSDGGAVDAGADAGSPYDGGMPPGARHLYWVEGRAVMRSALDGSGVTTVLSNVPTWVEDIDYDPVADRILLLDTLHDDFLAAASGADCATAGACPIVHSTGSPVTSFAVDGPGHRIFWSVGSLFGGASGGYGSPLSPLADTRFYPSTEVDCTAWDGAYGWVYFGESAGSLRRVRPDGASPQAASTTFASGIHRVALDPAGDRAYLVVYQPSSARDLARVDLTLGAPTLAARNPIRLVTGVVSGGSITFDVSNVAFDVTTRRLFWRARRGTMHEIWSGDVDGAGATMLRSFLNDGQTGTAFSILED